MSDNILNEEEKKTLDEGIRRALNENYVLKAAGETDEDCIVHDIIATVWNLLAYRRSLMTDEGLEKAPVLPPNFISETEFCQSCGVATWENATEAQRDAAHEHYAAACTARIEQAKREGIDMGENGVLAWLCLYSTRGGKQALDEVLEDMRVHSQYGKQLAKMLTLDRAALEE